MSVVAYMTHPLGDRDAGHGVDRGDNISNAMSWFRFLVMVTPWAISAPWFPYVASIDDVFHASKVFLHQLTFIGRSDVLIAVGGRISAHMEFQIEYAGMDRPSISRVPVLSLVEFGSSPPWREIDQVGKKILDMGRNLGLDDDD